MNSPKFTSKITMYLLYILIFIKLILYKLQSLFQNKEMIFSFFIKIHNLDVSSSFDINRINLIIKLSIFCWCCSKRTKRRDFEFLLRMKNIICFFCCLLYIPFQSKLWIFIFFYFTVVMLFRLNHVISREFTWIHQNSPNFIAKNNNIHVNLRDFAWSHRNSFSKLLI